MIKITVIESPYGRNPDGSAADQATIDRNLRYVRAAMADCFAQGEIPYASHAIYTQPGVLDDTKPEERRRGMTAGFELRRILGAASDEINDVIVQTAIYEDLGITPGMHAGAVQSIEDMVPVVHRRLGGEWAL